MPLLSIPFHMLTLLKSADRMPNTRIELGPGRIDSGKQDMIGDIQ
jgi:hypothetical protein